MIKAGKVWGTTAPLLLEPGVQLHAISVLPNARCSLHRHATRWNGFLVTSGRLTVEVHQADYDLVDSTVLGPGEFTTVAPGLWHRFVSGPEGATCFELYYPASLEARDIERRDVGAREGA